MRHADPCEEKRHRKREGGLKDQKVHLGALLVLKDENEDHDQDNDADDKRRPGSTEASFSLARVRFFGFCGLVGGSINHVRKSYSRLYRSESAGAIVVNTVAEAAAGIRLSQVTTRPTQSLTLCRRNVRIPTKASTNALAKALVPTMRLRTARNEHGTG